MNVFLGFGRKKGKQNDVNTVLHNSSSESVPTHYLSSFFIKFWVSADLE